LEISASSNDDVRLATSHRYLAIVLENRGRLKEAAVELQASLTLHERNSGKDKGSSAIADALIALARLNRLLAETADARSRLIRAEDLRASHFGRKSVEYADVLLEEARDYGAEQRFSEAEKLLRQAIEIKSNILGINDPAVAEAQCSLADTLVNQHGYADAEVLAQTALKASDSVFENDNPRALLLEIAE
jgi:tetratricopeptide (TPR) repeat protein